ncbi:hypothetical protein [Alkalibacillus silvisoli]|uniref:Uncharacterized protein n=1 Tax=Alkalibacillus silvisoli TaxID=392823 RepID=A0ABP3JHN5_9BACI
MLNCLCESERTNELKVEADISADPLWCNKCSANLDLEVIPLSNELKEELTHWVLKYGEWIDWDNDERIVLNGVKMENDHNKQGERLTVRVKGELEPEYAVRFSPATFAASTYGHHRN